MSKTLIQFLLDRSWSMNVIKEGTIGGFNTYLDGLKEGDDAEIFFSLIQFDSISIDTVYANRPIAEVPLLTDETFQPRRDTPLREAIYKTIKATEKAAGDAKVIIQILTDGFENASGPEYTDELVNALIEEKKKQGWQINFLGAGIDAYKDSSKIGLQADACMSYDSLDPQATQAAFAASAANHGAYARGQSLKSEYTRAQKASACDVYAPSEPNLIPVAVPFVATPGGAAMTSPLKVTLPEPEHNSLGDFWLPNLDRAD